MIIASSEHAVGIRGHCVGPIPADADMNCDVDLIDMVFVRERLRNDPATDDNWQADVNQDERINILNLLQVRNGLRATCE